MEPEALAQEGAALWPLQDEDFLANRDGLLVAAGIPDLCSKSFAPEIAAYGSVTFGARHLGEKFCRGDWNHQKRKLITHDASQLRSPAKFRIKRTEMPAHPPEVMSHDFVIEAFEATVFAQFD